MRISEILEGLDLFEKQVWSKTGKKLVRKFRCTSGPRRNRIVSNMAQCFKPIDIKKRTQMKQTRARLGNRMVRKAKRTKRLSPLSKRIQRLNKR